MLPNNAGKIQSASPASDVHCEECARIVHIPRLAHKQRAHCPRCRYILTTYYHNMASKIVALALAALIFMLASVSFEFLSFSANGQSHTIDMLGSIQTLIDYDYALLAILLIAAILLLPLSVLLGLLYLLLPVVFGSRPRYARPVIKLIFALLPWTMAEIFLVAVLVSLVKIMSMADIGIGLSFYAYALFTLCMTGCLLYLDRYQLYLLTTSKAPPHAPLAAHSSIQFTWALLATSVLLYIPANILPIMHTNILGDDEPSTILGGVILLWQMGSYPVAAIIFIASIFVPIAKICILCWLNYSVQVGFNHKKQERMICYRITEFVGRWSMIDVFVVAILVSLIQLGNIMSIYPGYAALAFCAVVILTMLAAQTFDTKLIWSKQ
ncbi:MAG: paraquat-inducible protein A [Paraglaciecola sp.]